jgi:hypothetical protein
VQAELDRLARQPRIDDAGLHARESVDRVDVENAREAIEADEHDAVGEGAA